jgi:hypothetical protein
VHRSGANLRSSDFQPSTLPMRHCYIVQNFNFKSIYPDVSSVRPVSCAHALALVHDLVASMLLKVFPLLSALLLLVSMLLSFLMLLLAPMYLLVFLRLLALLLLALLYYECCSMMSLLLLFFPSPCRKSLPDSLGPWKEAFCIPQCREILVPGARQGLPPEARLLWHGGM